MTKKCKKIGNVNWRYGKGFYYLGNAELRRMLDCRMKGVAKIRTMSSNYYGNVFTLVLKKKGGSK